MTAVLRDNGALKALQGWRRGRSRAPDVENGTFSFAVIRSLSYYSACSHSSYFLPRAQNEKATRQLGGLFSRENSSNGGLESRQNFLPKSYERKNRGVKRFLRNKYLCFQHVTNIVNILPNV